MPEQYLHDSWADVSQATIDGYSCLAIYSFVEFNASVAF